jgi:gas vesicle protein
VADQQDSGGSVVSFLVGLGIGAAVAAVTAILYAPKAGAEVRHDLAEAARDLGSRTEKVAEQVRDAAREVTSRLKRDLEAAVTEAKQAASACAADLEEKARRGRG